MRLRAFEESAIVDDVAVRCCNRRDLPDISDSAFAAFVASELLRVKDLKFSLLWKQVSDSVVDSKILGSRPDSPFRAKQILQPKNAIAKPAKTAADGDAPLAPAILKKPGDGTEASRQCRVTFQFDTAPPDIPAKKKKKGKARVRGAPVVDSETSLIEEIRAEASVARRMHRETKRVRAFRTAVL
jgi:hypothetical protein